MENVTTAINHSSGTNTITCTVLGENDFGTAALSEYAKLVLAEADATLTAPAGYDVTTTVENSMVKYENGTYKVVKAVAKIGEDELFESFEAALNAVQNGETITLLNVEGSEINKEIDFIKDITFTITGDAPNYALPTVTFQNATVNIKDATILIPELDARQNATINVIDSTVYDAGGNSIVKSYYNGAINISGTSVVYTMQVTTMGYITISDSAVLNATWQTNVYGNGMITVKDDAQFNTAALQLTGKDYEGRDNTDADRVGKPATIVVDGATFIVGSVKASNGADYSYHSSYGINIGTIDGKAAVLDIKNNATVEFYMANDQTANVGAGGTVNVDGTVKVACRGNGTATLENNGSIVLTDIDAILTSNECGDVTTTVDGYEVVYENGVYSLAEALFDITFANMDLKSSMAMNFAFAKNSIVDWTGCYAEITKEYADGRENVVQILNVEDWKTANINGVAHYYVTFTGIAAKEMTDNISVVIYDADGNAISETYVDSVRDYAMRQINDSDTDVEWLKAFVDMLNYGAAAQDEFDDYHIDDLANSKLTDAQKAYASTETTEYENTRVVDSNYLGSSLLLKENIILLMAFKNVNPEMDVTITYTNHYSDNKVINTELVEGTRYGMSGYYVVVIDALAIADARQDVTVTITNDTGVVASATDSIESYVARQMDKGENVLYDLIMKFADSSYAALH